MKPRSSYDVVVLGATLAAVGAGALLARRGFRVLVLGQGLRPDTYGYEGFALRRVSPTVSFVEAPAFNRLISELAMVPTVRRRVQAREPAFQVVMPGHRVDASAQRERQLVELNREFGEIQRPIEDFYRRLDTEHEALDRVFSADVALPPEGFWARREAARAASAAPFDREGEGRDLYAEFASDHPFRLVVESTLRFGADSDPDAVTALGRTRLHAAAFRGVSLAEGGVEGLRALFEEKIIQFGGEVRLRDRAESIAVQRRRVTGLSLAGLDEAIGCRFIVSGIDPAETLRLTGDEPSRDFTRRLLGVRPRYHRYVLNAIVRAEGVPVGMASRVFAIVDRKRPLTEENLLAIDVGDADDEGLVALTVTALLPRSLVEEGGNHVRRVRQRVMRALGEVMPFLERHLVLVDSPHDGAPLEDRRSGAPVMVELRRGGLAEPMETLDLHDAPRWLGVCGLPVETEVSGLLLAGRGVVPGLGVEGEFLAALGAARVVTRSDPSRERMRRELWSKPPR